MHTLKTTTTLIVSSALMLFTQAHPRPNASPSPARQKGAAVPSILLAISNVSTSVQALDASIAGIQPGPASLSTLTQVLASSNAVQQALQAGTASVQATPGMLTVAEANDLRDNTDVLVAQTQATVAALVVRQAIVLQAGAGPTTLRVIQSQKATAMGFADALRDKVPVKQKQQKNAAASMANVAAAFDQGIAAFSVAAPPAVPGVTAAAQGGGRKGGKKKDAE